MCKKTNHTPDELVTNLDQFPREAPYGMTSSPPPLVDTDNGLSWKTCLWILMIDVAAIVGLAAWFGGC